MLIDFVKTSPDILRLVALAEWAKRVGRDPCAAFATLLREKRWNFIANADEV